jgi:DNA-binding SARP family transcriptional activator
MDFVARARYDEAESYLRLAEKAESSGQPQVEIIWLYAHALALLCELGVQDDRFRACLRALARLESARARAEPARVTAMLPPRDHGERGLEVRALGPLHVLRAGQAINGPIWHGSRTLELLELVVSAGEQPTPLDVAIECLWPRAPQAAGLAALKTTLHRLRHRLESGLHRGDRSSYLSLEHRVLWLNREHCWTDVAEFDAAIREGRQRQRDGQPITACRHYRRAADLYAGSLLSDERYLEWVAEPRQQRQTQVLEALSTLAGWAEQRQELVEAAAWYERYLEIEHCAETAAQRLIRIQSRLGRRVEAIRTFLALRKALSTELDLDPSPETFALFRSIQSHLE